MRSKASLAAASHCCRSCSRSRLGGGVVGDMGVSRQGRKRFGARFVSGQATKSAGAQLRNCTPARALSLTAARPGEGGLDSFAENWLGPLVFGGGGLLFTGVGVGLLVARRRALREPAA